MNNRLDSWVEFDRDEIRQQAERTLAASGFGLLGKEVYRNTIFSGATELELLIGRYEDEPMALVKAYSDGGGRFRCLDDAWQMFAPRLGHTKHDAQAGPRDRYLLACCETALIDTSFGAIETAPQGRANHPDWGIGSGLEFGADIPCGKAQYDELLSFHSDLLVPHGFRLVVNGTTVESHRPVTIFMARLETEVFDGDLISRPKQDTIVEVYDAPPGEMGMVHEYGIPIAGSDDGRHYSVTQRVPLDAAGERVRPSFLRRLKAMVHEAETGKRDAIKLPSKGLGTVPPLSVKRQSIRLGDLLGIGPDADDAATTPRPRNRSEGDGKQANRRAVPNRHDAILPKDRPVSKRRLPR